LTEDSRDDHKIKRISKRQGRSEIRSQGRPSALVLIANKSAAMHSEGDDENESDKKFSLVLPVLFYEYLALSLSKSLVPFMIIQAYGDWSYFVVGVIETLKGVLSFISCPFFGKLSDEIGRKRCLLFTVVGTTFPVCALAFTENMWVFAALQALSGFFSATFPLTFAYISDCVERKDRAPAYGLALATFGLSFCIGPVAGGLIAAAYGRRMVFICALVLVVMDVVYIVTTLPETLPHVRAGRAPAVSGFESALALLPNTWRFGTTFRIFQSVQNSVT